MSLFKSRDFWNTNSDLTNEEFDCMSLKMNKLNSENDFILCGSHMGVLRIYKPSCDMSKGILSGYKPSDLYVEKHLAAPILQLDCGRLVSGSPLTQLAILHPRSFAVYSFATKQGTTEQGNQNMVNLLYEHKLRRSAANFTIGQFGNTQNRDFIAVQSLDGMLSFYEQETFVFCCFLPDFLLPGCFVYMKFTDCFLITGSTMTIESYSYKNLSSCGQNSDENDAGGTKCQCDWSINVSEPILEVAYLYDGFSKESYIVALGEKNIFCMNHAGKMRFMKRFDFTPMTMTAYLINGNIITALVSETSTLLLFENTTLKWSAQLPEVPVAIARGHFRNLRGVFVALSESGNLRCSYLGTQPNLFQAPPLQSLELDYEDADRELTELTKIIKSSYNELKGTNSENDLLLVSKVLSYDETKQSALIEITITPNAVFEEVNVLINTHKPLIATPNLMFFDAGFNVKTTFTAVIQPQVKAYQNKPQENKHINCLEIEIIATCVSTIGIPKVIRQNLTLEPQLAFIATLPQKENNLKIVLNINETAPTLLELFPEFVDVNTPNTLALKVNSTLTENDTEKQEVVTILLAKSSSRYRLQADNLSFLFLPLKLLISRLQKHFKNNRNLKISCSGNLPLKDLFADVKEHYNATKEIERYQLQLIELGSQFRMIQKRLISKFRDRHPVPLNNLNMLLQDTYSEILSVTEKLELLNLNLGKRQMILSSSLSIIATLLQLSNSNIDEVVLDNLLSIPVVDVDGLQWEDLMDANISYLLRTLLAKSEKDKLRGCVDSYERVTDYAKFEKHLGVVLERLLKKGVKLDEAISNDDALDKDEEKEKDDVVKSIGSKFAESSTRALSARHRTSIEANPN